MDILLESYIWTLTINILYKVHSHLRTKYIITHEKGACQC